MFSMKNEENVQCPKRMEMFFSQSNCHSLKCFLGYLQSSGSSLAEKILPQFREFFLQFPERIIKQITFPKKVLPQNVSNADVGFSFESPVEMFSLKRRNFFDQCSKMDKFLFLLHFFLKIFFVSSNCCKGQTEGSFDNRF